MLRYGRCIAVASLLLMITASSGTAIAQDLQPAIAIHGGAGTIPRGSMTAELEKDYRDTMTASLKAGQSVLLAGGSAVDAVVAAIRIMEDSPLFNAGKGAVFTNLGTNEMDASIMDGSTQKAGAIAGVRRVKNPIEAARAVMDKSRHVMFAGEGADAFAKAQGLEIVPESYFATERRLEQLERAKKRDQLQLDHTPAPPAKKTDLLHDSDSKYGTVGAVALDRRGNLAAGTSTGGLTNKMPGRIGDSPIIGAGTYAQNGLVAISATGTGEMFMRSVAAYDVAARMKYGREQSAVAGSNALEQVRKLGGNGGFVIMDVTGETNFVFNTSGMYRGSATGSAEPKVMIYGNE
jgi:L-asparaginase / beta-aspartyl-peptidase